MRSKNQIAKFMYLSIVSELASILTGLDGEAGALLALLALQLATKIFPANGHNSMRDVRSFMQSVFIYVTN